MRKHGVVVLLSIAAAACGSSTIPSRVPVSIAGEWSGNVNVLDGDLRSGSGSWTTSLDCRASIAQTGATATGHFTAPGMASATFSGTVTGTSFEGTVTLIDRAGCAVEAGLTGSVSDRSLRWSTLPPGPGCDWRTRFVLTLTRQ